MLVAGVGIGLKADTSQNITKGENDEWQVHTISSLVEPKLDEQLCGSEGLCINENTII